MVVFYIDLDCFIGDIFQGTYCYVNYKNRFIELKSSHFLSVTQLDKVLS